jgi:hypothetical protein
VLVQDSFTVSAKHRLEIVWTHPMVLLDDEAQVDDHFGLFGDRVNLDAR